ncbi:MAG: DHH family phosphoesterase [bacterium]|nr:DHH family phosphoesterase [bacterium]
MQLPEDPRKIVVFAHWDADGIASAVMFAEFLSWKYRIPAEKVRVVFPAHGRISIIDYVEDLPRDFCVVCLDLALAEKELEKLERKFSSIIFIDHHRNVDKPYAITDSSCKSNAELVYKLLREEGYEPRKLLLQVGMLGDMGEVKPEDPLLLGKLHDTQKSVLEDVVTLINSDYRARWDARTAFQALLRLEPLDLVFARHPLAQRLHEARKAVNDELRELRRKLRIIDYDMILYTEISSRLYIQGLLATVLMLEHGKPVLCVNRLGAACYAELRARQPEIDFGSLFFELAQRLGIEAGGHRDAAGAYYHVREADRFLRELLRLVGHEAKGETSG